MLALSNGYQTLVGGLHKEYDGGGDILTGETSGTGKVPRVHVRFGGGSAGENCQSHNGISWGPQWEGTLPPPIPQAIQGILNSGVWVIGVSSGGL